MELNPKAEHKEQALKVLKVCDTNRTNEVDLTYDERNPFVVCTYLAPPPGQRARERERRRASLHLELHPAASAHNHQQRCNQSPLCQGRGARGCARVSLSLFLTLDIYIYIYIYIYVYRRFPLSLPARVPSGSASSLLVGEQEIFHACLSRAASGALQLLHCGFRPKIQGTSVSCLRGMPLSRTRVHSSALSVFPVCVRVRHGRECDRQIIRIYIHVSRVYWFGYYTRQPHDTKCCVHRVVCIMCNTDRRDWVQGYGAGQLAAAARQGGSGPGRFRHG